MLCAAEVVELFDSRVDFSGIADLSVDFSGLLVRLGVSRQGQKEADRAEDVISQLVCFECTTTRLQITKALQCITVSLVGTSNNILWL